MNQVSKTITLNEYGTLINYLKFICFIDVFFKDIEPIFKIHKELDYGKINIEHIEHFFLKVHNPAFTYHKFTNLSKNNKELNIYNLLWKHFKQTIYTLALCQIASSILVYANTFILDLINTNLKYLN